MRAGREVYRVRYSRETNAHRPGRRYVKQEAKIVYLLEW